MVSAGRAPNGSVGTTVTAIKIAAPNTARIAAKRVRNRLAGLGAAVFAQSGSEAAAFGLDDVAKRAEAQARVPFRPPAGEVPDWLTKISYDQWRDIRFRPERALWSENRSSFQVQFFHVGLFYDRAVKINVFDAEGVRPVQFSPFSSQGGSLWLKNPFSPISRLNQSAATFIVGERERHGRPKLARYSLMISRNSHSISSISGSAEASPETETAARATRTRRTVPPGDVGTGRS